MGDKMLEIKFFVIFLLFLPMLIPAFGEPTLKDKEYVIEIFVEDLSFPTTMSFIDEDVLVLQKNDGKVRLIQNGILQEDPILDFHVDGLLSGETGLLGILTIDSTVYLYVTEATQDGGEQIANRIYKYDWNGNSLTNPTLIHEFPPAHRAAHVGGIMVKGLDDTIFVVIGDMSSSNDGLEGPTQNHPNGEIRDTSIILKVVPDGSVLKPSQSPNPNEYYHAIGIRNSFGLAIDHVTGNLWDTENGPWNFDEINLVFPKFNSGWEKIMGPATPSQIESLPVFGDFKYSDPEFSWQKTIAPTSIIFVESKYFEKYKDNLLVADCINGNLYEFKLNPERTELVFETTGLQDRILNNVDAMKEIILGTGFGCITDLKFGPDGFLYIVSISDGRIYRIIPSEKSTDEEKINGNDMKKIQPFTDLSNADLRNVDLVKADLRFANLTNANLFGANLSHANLLHAEFTQADLSNTDLSHANLKQGLLKNANLESANLMESELLGAYFGYAILKNANLKDSGIKSANFTHANLESANLENVDFRASDLSYADFSLANLKNANLAHSDLSYADFSGSDLSGLYYYNTDVTGVVTNNDTKVDGCFGQDLWNRGLSKVFRWLNQQDSDFLKSIGGIIQNFCVR